MPHLRHLEVQSTVLSGTVVEAQIATTSTLFVQLTFTTYTDYLQNTVSHNSLNIKVQTSTKQQTFTFSRSIALNNLPFALH